MSTHAASPRRRRGLASRLASVFGNGLVNVILGVVAVFWMVPTFGLLITSLRSSANLVRISTCCLPVRFYR